MDTQSRTSDCQIASVHKISAPPGMFDTLHHYFFKAMWAVARRIFFVWRTISRRPPRPPRIRPGTAQPALLPGAAVRVRSRPEIQRSLDAWEELDGCAFMDEMWAYCGTTQRVYQRVEKFVDERDYRLKRASGIVLLENIYCHGVKTLGRCDRSCFYFWREEWLERI